MSKVIVTEVKNIQTEIDLEYPIYLYFQDCDMGTEELIMVNKKDYIKVFSDRWNMIINKSFLPFQLPEVYIKNNLTTEEHFLEIYNEVLDNMKK